MTEKEKIENAALYWFTCKKEGFPKGQKEVFYEWINQKRQHKIAYTKLDCRIENTLLLKDKILKKKKRQLLPPAYFIAGLLFFIIIVVFKQ